METIFAVEPSRIKGRKPRVLTAGHVKWIGLEVRFLRSGCRIAISQNCAVCIGATCEPLQNQATGRRRTLLERRKHEKKMQRVAIRGGEPKVFIFITSWCTLTSGRTGSSVQSGTYDICHVGKANVLLEELFQDLVYLDEFWSISLRRSSGCILWHMVRSYKMETPKV